MLLMVCFCAGSAAAQDREVMSTFQAELQKLFSTVTSAATDNERYNANEQVVQLFANALEQPNSFFWTWDFGRTVSVLTSKDKQFRIITWPVLRDDGEYECFGFVQSYNVKDERYDVFELNDKSVEIVNVEEAVLSPENWLGCVYQELIETKFEGKMYYTLIGWTCVDNLTQRKVIEPIAFKGNASRPMFGQALFRREKNRRRVVLEYTRTAMVNVRYDEQFVRSYVNKKTKGKNGRVVNTQEAVDTKSQMIIFDEVDAMIPGMEGLFQYYVPTGTEMAYIFREGKWELHRNAQGRDANSKLNKEFAPLPKTAPAYQLPEQDEE